jgi:hypothetical protein
MMPHHCKLAMKNCHHEIRRHKIRAKCWVLIVACMSLTVFAHTMTANASQRSATWRRAANFLLDGQPRIRTRLGIPRRGSSPSIPARQPADSATASESRFPSGQEDPITARELLDHIDVLAGEEFEGRKAGTAGGKRAAEYIVTQLQALKLQPMGDGDGFLQNVGDKYQNVLGLLPGSDNESGGPVVVIGAHYDHLGIRRSRNGSVRLFNGADDNASGVSAVLELAEFFATSSVRPRHSILFACWDAEEIGLIGSRHWVSHPTIPLKRIQFVINLDMLGRLRDNQLIVFGTNSAPGLRRLVTAHNRASQLDLDFRSKIIRQSDHDSFFQENIPVLFPWTGMHRQLHRETDDVELINEEDMQRATDLVRDIVWDLANRDTMPPFREDAKQEIQRSPAAPATPIQPLPEDLQSAWGFTARSTDWEPHTLVVTGVAQDSQAASANLQVDDRIYEVQGLPVAETAQLPESLLTATSRTPLLVERRGRLLPLDLLPENHESVEVAEVESEAAEANSSERAASRAPQRQGKTERRIQYRHILCPFCRHR